MMPKSWRKLKIGTRFKKRKKLGQIQMKMTMMMMIYQQLESLTESTTADDESEIIHTANQFLQLLAQQRAYELRYKLPSTATITLNTVEQILLDSNITTCRKQISCHFSTIKMFTLFNKDFYMYKKINLCFINR